MSDRSLPHCVKCHEPEYACTCPVTECSVCGGKLDMDIRDSGLDVCFECYCDARDTNGRTS